MFATLATRLQPTALFAALTFLTVLTVSGCQYIIGIEDRNARTETRDAGPNAACNPVTQTVCASGQKCARHADDSVDPPEIRTECVPDGTRGFGETCTNDAPTDDCRGALTCIHGFCEDNCEAIRSACGPDLTCVDGFDAFPDRGDEFGVCAEQCDSTYQDCEIGEGCYARQLVFETQCRLHPPGQVLPRQDQPCFRNPGGCDPNGCDVGYGPHLPRAIDGEVLDCGFYCFPNDTYVGATDFASGGDSSGVGSCFDSNGPGDDNYQCRFLQTLFPGQEAFDKDVGVCVDSRAALWADCGDCDITSQSTAADCPPGCLSLGFIATLPP